MTNRLPPLVWLKAFEAAGRLQSFRAAAEELHVTPSAVSHHVRSLERRLGRPLFERAGNSVRLTREGQLYAARISEGFAHLSSAAEVFDVPAARRLTIGAFPFLVSEILVPNLGELRARLPGVALAVVSETDLGLLTHADPAQRVDAIVRYGDGRFPACTARKLTDVELVPVASPELLGTADGRDARRLLAHGPRVTIDGPFDGWSVWANATGVAISPRSDALAFDSYLSAMRAVEQGLGVGLGIRPFIDPWLAQGRVAIVLDEPVTADQASYLVTAQYAGARPELDVLADWLLARFVDR